MARTRIAVVAGVLLTACSGDGAHYVEHASFACEPAPGDLASISTGAPWRIGDRRDLTIGSASSSERALEPTGARPVEVTAIGASEGRSSLAWESPPTVLPDLVRLPGVGGDLVDLGDAVPPERVVYDVDGGVFAGVSNADEIRTTVGATFDLLQRSAMLDFHTSIRVRLTLDGLSDEVLAALYGEGPELYHRLDGLNLRLGESREESALLPNAFGGAPFPAIAVTEMTDLVDGDGCVSVRRTVSIDPAEARDVLAASLAAQGAATEGDAFDEAFEAFSAGRVLVGQYDHATGRLWKLSGVQLVRFGDQRRFDTTVISDVTALSTG